MKKNKNNNNIKIVTICGSMRFSEEMKKIAFDLELEKGYLVIQCVYNTDNIELNEDEINLMSKVHFNKIDISDAIYVVNIDGYIGESTRNEINYAEKTGKRIIYHEEI